MSALSILLGKPGGGEYKQKKSEGEHLKVFAKDLQRAADSGNWEEFVRIQKDMHDYFHAGEDND